MIIKGDPAGSVGFWSKHLLRDDTNEKVEVKEISGLVATDLPGALREMQAVASGSRSHGNFMYQANINPLAHEHLTPEQWKEAVDTLERNLGLEGHQRVVVEHIKEGRQHHHIVWNRADIETMKVADMGGNYPVHERTSRELEARFGLTPTPTVAPSERTPSEQLWEKRAAERSGIDPKAMRIELTEIWRSTDSGATFKAAIEERGYILAKGDRRDFCIVDRAGDAHSLARRLSGIKAAGVREHMADIDRDALPSVEDARQRQRARPPRGPEPLKTIDDQTNARHASEVERAKALPDLSTVSKNSAVGKPREEEFEPSQSQPFKEGAKSSNAKAAGVPGGVSLGVASKLGDGVEKLADFVADFLTGAAPPPKRDPHADQVEQLIDQRRALAALENIRNDIEKGKALRPEDVQNLTSEHLLNIRAKGDVYLQDLIRRMEDDRDREHERGRSRER